VTTSIGSAEPSKIMSPTFEGSQKSQVALCCEHHNWVPGQKRFRSGMQLGAVHHLGL